MYIIYISLTPPSGPRVSHLVCTTHNISYALVVTSVSCVLSYARGCCPVVCVRSRCRDKVGFIIVLHLNNSMTASQQPHDSFTTACACGLG